MGGDGEAEIDRISSAQFWRNWRDGLRNIGYYGEEFNPNGENEPKGFWIAIVDGHENGFSHAVVMKGKKLHYDPSANRTQRPHKFLVGYKLIPNVNN